jgi:hypothetical protein
VSAETSRRFEHKFAHHALEAIKRSIMLILALQSLECFVANTALEVVMDLVVIDLVVTGQSVDSSEGDLASVAWKIVCEVVVVLKRAGLFQGPLGTTLSSAASKSSAKSNKLHQWTTNSLQAWRTGFDNSTKEECHLPKPAGSPKGPSNPPFHLLLENHQWKWSNCLKAWRTKEIAIRRGPFSQHTISGCSVVVGEGGVLAFCTQLQF